MFDLTDDVENSLDNTQKAKPAEVKVDYTIKPKIKETPKFKEVKPDWADKKSDDYNEYEYSNDTEEDDSKW